MNIKDRPGYKLWVKGKTRLEMENANRTAHLPCYCANLWNGFCDFCNGLARAEDVRGKEQLRFQTAKAVYEAKS